MQFAPSDPDVAYALPLGIIKSTNGGITWENASEKLRFSRTSRPLNLAIDPHSSETVYVGVGGWWGGGLIKSTDGGRQWEALGDSFFVDGVSNLAVGPGDSPVLYAGAQMSGAILKSTDRGETWNLAGPESRSFANFIAVSPLSGKRVYAYLRRDGLFVSEDGGASWHEEALPDSVEFGFDLAFHSTRNDLYLATDKGVYRKRGTGKWEPLNEGLVHTRVRRLAISPDGERIYAGLDWTDVGGVGMYARGLPR